MERHMLLCTSSFVKHFMLFISVSTRLCEQTQVTDISLTPSQHFPDSQATVTLFSSEYTVALNLPC